MNMTLATHAMSFMSEDLLILSTSPREKYQATAVCDDLEDIFGHLLYKRTVINDHLDYPAIYNAYMPHGSFVARFDFYA
jgi:hypothetical protein